MADVIFFFTCSKQYNFSNKHNSYYHLPIESLSVEQRQINNCYQDCKQLQQWLSRCIQSLAVLQRTFKIKQEITSKFDPQQQSDAPENIYNHKTLEKYPHQYNKDTLYKNNQHSPTYFQFSEGKGHSFTNQDYRPIVKNYHPMNNNWPYYQHPSREVLSETRNTQQQGNSNNNQLDQKEENYHENLYNDRDQKSSRSSEYEKKGKHKSRFSERKHYSKYSERDSESRKNHKKSINKPIDPTQNSKDKSKHSHENRSRSRDRNDNSYKNSNENRSNSNENRSNSNNKSNSNHRTKDPKQI